ncbi:hypothetical protein Tco_0899230, partial [Tanacetum coccineum]
KMKKIEDMVKGIEQSCLDIINQDEDDVSEPPSQSCINFNLWQKMKKIEDMVKGIEQSCLDIIDQDEDDVSEPPSQSCINFNLWQKMKKIEDMEQEECVGVERLKNGDLRFVLSCACGKRFEMLLKNNGYCFYKLT